MTTGRAHLSRAATRRVRRAAAAVAGTTAMTAWGVHAGKPVTAATGAAVCAVVSRYVMRLWQRAWKSADRAADRAKVDAAGRVWIESDERVRPDRRIATAIDHRHR